MSALISTAPLNKVASVKEMLANKNAASQLASVAASHLTPERLMRTVALSVSKNPKLAECTPMSLLGSLMASANLGLVPNTPHGHAYLVPYGKEAVLVIGYRGYIQLAYNSQQVASVSAGIHYSDDEHWIWREGANPTLEHTPGPMAGDMLHAYAIMTRADGNKTWVVWPEAKLVAHRDRYSQGYKADIRRGKKATDSNVNVWLGNPDIARMKTMIRQLAKYMPMASEIPQAAALDGARADYAGYALDPSSGLPDPDVIDGEATGEIDMPEQDEPEAPPAKQEQTEPADSGRANLKAAGQSLKAKATEKGRPSKPSMGDQSDALHRPPEPDYSKKIAGILQDALDGGVPGAMAFHAEKIDEIKAKAPKQHAEFMEEIDRYQKAEDDA